MQSLTDDDILATRLAEQRTRVAQLQREHAARAEQLAVQVAELAMLEEEARRRRLAFARTAAKAVDWASALDEGQGVEHHNATQRALEALGLSSFGYFPETLQRCVCIRMSRDRDTEVDDLAASLEVLMPHVRPLPDGWCSIGVQEHAAAGNNYHLRFRQGGSQFQCVNLRLRAPEVELASADLRTVLAHIQRHHFFE